MDTNGIGYNETRTSVSVTRATRAQLWRACITVAEKAEREKPFSIHRMIELLAKHAEAHPDAIAAFLKESDTER